jgi:hypothetical protein
VRVTLPKCTGASGVDLDVIDRQLVLHSAEPDYHLELTLAYAVDGDRGRARFDKQARQLIVTLPVRPLAPAPTLAPSFPAPSVTELEDGEPEPVVAAAAPPAVTTTLPAAPTAAATPALTLMQTEATATVIVHAAHACDVALSFTERAFGPVVVHTAHVSLAPPAGCR